MAYWDQSILSKCDRNLVVLTWFTSRTKTVSLDAEIEVSKWIENIGRWSEMSVKNSPLLDLSKNWLTKMLSIKVAEWQVILVGRVINGKNIFEYSASKNAPLGWEDFLPLDEVRSRYLDENGTLTIQISYQLFTWVFFIFFYFLILYLSRGIQFSRASLNGALTKHKNKDIKTLKLDN